MADNRYVNTGFWRDTYVRTLSSNEKIVFLYLLTNPETNIAGIYEINPEQVALDTKIGGKSGQNSGKAVEKVFIKLQHDGKIYYKNGWIVLKNWTKHQKMNPSVQLGIKRVLENIPKWLRIELGLEVDDAQLSLGSIEPEHRLGTASTILNLTKLNLNANVTNERDTNANNFYDKSKNTNRRYVKRGKSMEEFGSLSRKQLRERGL